MVYYDNSLFSKLTPWLWGMGKPTPGPWEWESNGDGVFKTWKLVSLANYDHYSVMEFTPLGQLDAQPVLSDRNGENHPGTMFPAHGIDLRLHPDTMLMAAAPELLRTLQIILDAIDYTNNACRPNEMVGGVIDKETLLSAKLVIMNATGRRP